MLRFCSPVTPSFQRTLPYTPPIPSPDHHPLNTPTSLVSLTLFRRPSPPGKPLQPTVRHPAVRCQGVHRCRTRFNLKSEGRSHLPIDRRPQTLCGSGSARAELRRRHVASWLCVRLLQGFCRPSNIEGPDLINENITPVTGLASAAQGTADLKRPTAHPTASQQPRKTRHRRTSLPDCRILEHRTAGIETSQTTLLTRTFIDFTPKQHRQDGLRRLRLPCEARRASRAL